MIKNLQKKRLNTECVRHFQSKTKPNFRRLKTYRGEPKRIDVQSRLKVAKFEPKLTAHNGFASHSWTNRSNLPTWCRKLKSIKTARRFVSAKISKASVMSKKIKQKIAESIFN